MMASLKNVSVRHLRELARKHLGPGYTKLKTKDELLSALKKLVPGLIVEASRKVTKRAEKPAKAAPGTHPETQRKKAASQRAGGGEDAQSLRPSAQAERQGRSDEAEPAMRPRSTETESRAPEPFVPPPRPPTPRGNGNGRRRGAPVAAEPLVEGFFVARVAGEMEARRHHLTEDQVRAPVEHGLGLHYDERLPDIPWEYQDDRVVLLARDPFTLFSYWDFHPETRRGALEGLDQPRVVLRVLENGHEVRTIDVALESRNFYLHGLRPGRPYRVELHALGRDGTSRRIGPASNDVALPANEVSSDTTVRFMRVPWGVPLSRLREILQAGEAEIRVPPEPPEPLEIMHSRWVPLPNSGSWQLERWIERIPREAPPGGAPERRLPHLELGPYPSGGASSWTLVSSWWSSPTGASWAVPPSGRGRKE